MLTVHLRSRNHQGFLSIPAHVHTQPINLVNQLKLVALLSRAALAQEPTAIDTLSLIV